MHGASAPFFWSAAVMIFPRLVYKGPTVHLLVHGMAEYEAALEDGWNGCASEPVKVAPEPVAPVAASVAPVAEPEPADDAPPTRAEMIAQLEKLGIDVDKRWGDKRLMAEIDKAAGG
jgi:hypothetical protein